MDNYCKADEGGVTHVVPALDFGRRCFCGRKVFVMTDSPPACMLRDAPTRERLSALVLLLSAARKASGTRSLAETRLFC